MALNKVKLSSYCKPLGRYLYWWMIRSSPRISSAQYQFLMAEVDTAVLTSVLKYWIKQLFLYLSLCYSTNSKQFLKLRLICQSDMYLSGFGIHFLGLFFFLYVLLLAKTCASHVSFPNFWGLAILMKFKKQKGLCGTKLGIVKLILINMLFLLLCGISHCQHA